MIRTATVALVVVGSGAELLVPQHDPLVPGQHAQEVVVPEEKGRQVSRSLLSEPKEKKDAKEKEQQEKEQQEEKREQRSLQSDELAAQQNNFWSFDWCTVM